MYTSDKPASEKRYPAVIWAYLTATVGCAVFGAVYELFSHEVYSYFMIYAFAFPLLGGAIPFFLMHKAGKPFPGRTADLIHAGVAALTAGSVLQGVLEIYGTSNPLTAVCWIVGAGLTAAGWSAAVLRRSGSSPPITRHRRPHRKKNTAPRSGLPRRRPERGAFSVTGSPQPTRRSGRCRRAGFPNCAEGGGTVLRKKAGKISSRSQAKH